MAELCWIEDSFHYISSNLVIEAVAVGITFLVVLVDTSLAAFVDGSKVEADGFVVDHVAAK